VLRRRELAIKPAEYVFQLIEASPPELAVGGTSAPGDVGFERGGRDWHSTFGQGFGNLHVAEIAVVFKVLHRRFSSPTPSSDEKNITTLF
jgi:hypothetical protein